MKYIPASALPTALIISTLMFLIVMGYLLILENDITYEAGQHYQYQQRLYTESGFLYYIMDSLSGTITANDSIRISLFPDDPHSTVTLTRKIWGVYDIITITPEHSGERSIRLFGKVMPENIHPVLWMRNNQKSILISGDTRIAGASCLPDNGIRYGQIQSRFFSGIALNEEQIHISTSELPPLNSLRIAEIISSIETNETMLTPEDLPPYRSFYATTLNSWSGDTLSGVNLQGNFCLHADSLYIRSDCRLNNILITAGKIRIGSGFRGRLQLIARDSVIIEDGVTLEYPSGICLIAENSSPFISLDANASINGYILLESDNHTSNGLSPHYKQHPSATVRGWIRINGIAQIQGKVNGSVWLRDSYFFSPQGYYADILYDLNGSANERIAYPLVCGGRYERRCIQWLY